MSISQKTAWIQLVIFSLLLIGWAVLFGVNGSVFFWENDTMKDIYYYSCAGAFAILVGLNFVTGIAKQGRNALNDERDRAIFRKASGWASVFTLTAIFVALLELTITYMNRGTDIPIHFPLFIVLTAAAVMMFVQSFASVILYGRAVRHG